MKLSSKSILVILLVLLVTFSFTGWLHLQKERRVLTVLMEKHGKSLSLSIATSCIEILLSEDYPLLDTYLETMGKEMNDILFIEVLHHGKVVSGYLTNHVNISDSIVFNSDILFSIEQSKPLEKIGEVKLGLSDTENKLIIAARLRELIIIISSIFVFIALVEILLINRIVIRPIHKLAEGIHRVARGELAGSVEIKSRDEIGYLASSFNKMTKDLRETTVSRDYVDNIIKNMTESLITVSSEGIIRSFNRSALNLLGYTDEELLNQPVDVIFEIESSSNESVLNNLKKQDSASIVEKILLSKDGKKIPVLFSTSTMCDVNDNLREIICVALDITKRKQAEEHIKAALREKEILLREIYHRTQNNMQVICALLGLQSENIKDEQVLRYYEDIQNRINAMALVHQKLYQSKDLSNINFKSYIEDMAHNLFSTYQIDLKNISLKIKADDIVVTIDSAIPCGLAINEIITNSLKYAFPDNRDGEIRIDLHTTDNGLIELKIADNGIGMPKDFDLRNTNSIGLRLIVNLIEYQLRGEVELCLEQGVEFQIKFNELDRLKRV